MAETTPISEAVPDGLPPEIAALGNMILGAARLQVLHAVAVLHIADYLADAALTAEEVAVRTGSDPRATFRLMRAAASLGVLSYEGDRRFGLTGMGHLLRDGIPGSFRAFTLVQAGHAHWQAWGLFPDSVRKGASQAKRALGADIFELRGQVLDLPHAASRAREEAGRRGLSDRFSCRT